MGQLKELTGKTFGRWTVLRRKGSVQFGNGSVATWWCQCICGAEKEVNGSNLRNGKSTSCGCWMLERITTHGATKGYARSAEYLIWMGMRNRCRTTGDSRNRRYHGARGITVCERWNDYADFLADMGKRPSPKHSIDRINNDGNYEPENCRWATVSEQQRNRRISRNNTSGIEGITIREGRWTARIKALGKQLYLGTFDTKQEAQLARSVAVYVRDQMMTITNS
jgi:hypothetical protein